MQNATYCLRTKLYVIVSFVLASFTSFAQENSLHFDGSENISIAHTPDLTLSSFTIEAWVKTSQAGAPFVAVLRKPVAGNSNYFLAINNEKAHIRFDGSGGVGVDGTSSINDGKWHHIAGVFDNAGDLLSIYVDGVLENTLSSTQNPTTGTNPVTICEGGFVGEIDEVRIWNTARSSSEIQQNLDNSLTTGTGLVASYDFNVGAAGGTNTGITTLTDISTNTHDGTLSGFALTGTTSNWVASDAFSSINYGLDFDGVNDFVDLGSNIRSQLNGSANVTVEAWVYRTATKASHTIFGNYTSNLQTLLRIDSDKPAFFVSNGGAFVNATGVTSVPLNTWTHIAGSWDGSTIRVYINGLEDGSASRTGTLSIFGNGNYHIGGDAAATAGEWMQGQIDEVRVWNSTRTEDQLLAFKDIELNGGEPNLIGYWNFEEASGTSTVNIEGTTANNGTLTNMDGNTDWLISANGVSEAGILDSNPPSVSSITGPVSTTSDSPFQITIAFSEAVINFDISDLTVDNGTPSNLATANNISWTADITPTVAGSVTVDLGIGSFTDITGNANTSAAAQYAVIYLAIDPFITTWETTTASESISIPTFTGETYNYTVVWGDGNSETVTTDASPSHVYTTAGTYTVSISGDFPRIYFNNTGDITKIQTIEQWGDIAWTSMNAAFYGCSQLTYNASDVPDLSGATDMSFMFFAASSFNGNINNWDVSTITLMNHMFYHAGSFNQPLNLWDVSSVTNMGFMFRQIGSFNQDISDWDVSSVTNMSFMFWTSAGFNNGGVPLDWGVKTANVTTMENMFRQATGFNQPIGDWDVSSVTNMVNMISGTGMTFNQDISTWDVSNVTTMFQMFNQNVAFNNGGVALNWGAKTANVTNMSGILNQATAFDQEIGNWDISSLGGDISLNSTALSVANYDATLIGFADDNGATETIPSGTALQATGLTFSSAGQAARSTLINTYGWTITGDSESDYALDFNGSGQYVSTTKTTVNTEFTAEAWVYLNTLTPSSTGPATVISKWGGTNRDFVLSYTDNSTFYAQVLNDVTDANLTVTSSTVPSINTWYHLAFTFDGSNLKLYVNGVEEDIQSGTDVFDVTASSIRVGSTENGDSDWAGQIDEVRVWDVARTAQQIAAFKDVELDGLEPGLALYYSFFDGPSSGTVTDDSGNGFTGTLTTMDPATDWIVATHGVANAGVLDVTAPTVMITSTESGTTTLSPFPVTFTFDEEVVGWKVEDVAIINGVLTNSSTSDNITFTADAYPIQDGDVSIFVEVGHVTDLTGNDNAASSAFIISADLPQNALSFSASDYVNIPNDPLLDLAGPFTVEFWIRTNTTGGNVWIEKGTNNLEWSIQQFADNTVYMNFGNGGLNANIGVNDGNWHHVAVVYRGAADGAIYIDGVDETNTGSNSLGTPDYVTYDGALTIGGRAGSAFDLNGEFDEVRIWDDERTLGEVQSSRYSFLTSSEQGLVAYYKFDHSSGLTLLDLSSNTLDGTLTNMAGTEWTPSGAMAPTAYQATDASINGFTANRKAISNAQNITIDIDDDADFLSPFATDIAVSDPTSDFFFVAENLTSYVGQKLYYRLRFTDGPFTSPYSEAVEFMLNAGNALPFTGDDYVLVPDDPLLEPAGDFTVEFWYNSSAVGNNIILEKGNTNAEFSVQQSSGDNILLNVNNGITQTVGTYNDGNWHHIAVVYRGSSNATIYVDGVDDTGSNGVGTPAYGSGDFTIGSRLGSPGNVVDGSLDEIRIWDDERTLFEIQGNQFSTLTGSEQGLLAYYRFDETVGTILPDLSGNMLNGTLTNMAGTEWTLSGALQSANAPIPPSDLIAYRASATEIALEWTDNSDGETGYIVERSSTEDFSSDIALVTNLPANSNFHFFTEDPARRYYRVIAENANLPGSASSFIEFATTESHPGYAMNFPDADDRITLPSAGFGATTITVESWVNTTSTTDFSRVMSSGEAGGQRWSLNVNGVGWGFPLGKAVATAQFSGGAVYAASTTDVNDGDWHHVAGVYDLDNATVSIYIDGVLESTNSGSGTPSFNGDNVSIGNFYTGFNQSLLGSLDEVKTWSYLKTDFSDRFVSLQGDEPNLVAYYPFDENAVNAIVFDRSINTNDGTPTGSPLYINSGATGPTELVTQDISTNQINLQWVDNTENEEGFTIQRSTTGLFAGEEMDFPVAANLTNYIDNNGITPEAEYFYRVRADLPGATPSAYTAVKYAIAKAAPGSAYDFDGIGNFVDLGTNVNSILEGGTELALEAWIYPTTAVNEKTIIASYNDVSTMQYLLRFNTNIAIFYLGTGPATFQALTGTATIPLMTWTHVAATYDGSNMRLYINGVLDVTSGPVTTSIQSISGIPATIGAHGNNQYFPGSIDEVRIWNTTRTVQEVSDNKDRELDGNEQGLVAYYQLDEKSGTTVYDRSVNTNNGTNNGASIVAASAAMDTGVIPDVPTGLTARKISDTQIELNWTDVTNEQSYNIIRADDATLIPNQVIGNVAADVTTFVDNVSTDQGYFYIIQSVNGVDAATSAAPEFATTADHPGTALSFDGVDGYTNAPESLGPLSTLTVSAWIFPRSFGGSNSWVYWRGNTTVDPTGGEIYITPAGLVGYGESDVTNQSVSATTPIPLNEWSHVAVVKTGGTAQIYINGVADGSSGTIDGTPPNGEISLGARVRLSATDGFFDGLIDEVQVWDIAKTDFLDRFTQPDVQDANLVAYYPLDENAGTVTVDRSANENNGTINGGATFVNSTFADAPFITTWTATGGTITIPTRTPTFTYDYTVTYSNVTNPGIQEGSMTNQTADAVITGLEDGSTYSVEIIGSFPAIYFNNVTNTAKIQSIDQWGDIQWSSMEQAFFGCSNLTYNATDAPDLSNVTSLRDMFNAAFAFNGDLSNWDLTNVTNISYMFFNGIGFNGDVTTWNVSNVTDMFGTFSTTPFNQDISGWSVSNVVIMQQMFANSNMFNHDLSSWDVSSVTNMRSMFDGSAAFNQSLASWDVAAVTNMIFMLNNSGISTSNYDATLVGWAGQTVQSGVSLGATNLTYTSTGAAARNTLETTYSWTISGDQSLVPVAPTNVIAYSSASDEVTLSWTDNAINETGFSIERATDYAFSSPESVTTVAANISSATFPVISAPRYFYRVTATNGFEDASSSSSVEFASTEAFPGYALSFDGVDDYIQLPDLSATSLTPTGAFTIEAWVNSSLGGNTNILVIGADATNQNVVLKSGAGDVFLVNSSSKPGPSSSVASTDGQWHHLAATYDGTNTLTLYVDGNYIGDDNTFSFNLDLTKARIGVGADALTNYWNGQIDEVKIYNIAKTDFSDRFTKPVGNESGLVAYYSFDENTGTFLTDESINTNDGILLNGDNSTPADGITNGPIWQNSQVPLGPPMSVVSHVPAANAINIPANQVISIDFDVDVDLNSVNNFTVSPNQTIDDNITIIGNQTGIIEGSWAIGGDNTIVDFTTSLDFIKAGEVITVTVTAGVLGSGGEIAVPHTFQFSVESQVGPGIFPLAGNEIANTTDGPQSVYAADIDGDGDLDMVTTSELNSEVSWYENDGTGSFVSTVVSTNALSPRFAIASDLDKDGNMDIITSSGSDNEITWFQNDGSENFTEQVLSTSATQGWEIYVIDLDGDGDLDILNAALSSVGWYENDGSENFTYSEIANSLANARWITAGDLDNDGDLDLVSGEVNNARIAWYENDGNQSFTAQQVYSGSDFVTTDVQLVDMDNDGDLDMVNTAGQTSQIFWFENDGAADPAFSQQVFAPTAGGGGVSISVVDIEGDGDQDVLMSFSTDNAISLFTNDGLADPTFSETTLVSGLSGTRSVYAGDMDGDGDIDVLGTSYTDDKVVWYEQALPIPPNVISITPSVATISEAEVGTGVFSLAITYDQEMDPGVFPTIVFSPDVSGTITGIDTEGWSTNTLANDTYTANFNILDVNVDLIGIDVTVSAAQSLLSALQVSSTSTDLFDIDMVAPTIIINGPIATDDIVNTSEAASVTLSGTSDAEGRTVSLSVYDGTTTLFFMPIVTSGIWSTTVDLRSLQDAALIIDADVSDAAGNAAVTVSATVTLDQTNPVISINSPIADDDNVNASEATAVIVIGTSDENGQLVTINFDDSVNPFVTETAFVSGGFWSITADITSLNNGLITITGDVSDAAGNVTLATNAFVTMDQSIPTITLGTNPSINQGILTADLTYSGTTNSPNQYTIDFDVTAEGEGFIDVPNTILPASPIALTVPGSAISQTYNGTITVINTTTENSSAPQAFTLTLTTDVTAPTLTSVSIGMDPTGNVNYARTGDVIDIAFTSDEDITNVTASMLSGGNALTNSAPGVSGGPTNWNIRYGTTGTDTDGAFTFTIDYEDLTGNAGTQVTTVTDGSFVILNNTAPVISASSLSADNLTLTVDFDEDIFSDSDGLTAVALGNFALSQSGGVATASATSINVVSGTQVEITLSISGNSNGLEVITVEPNALIYNAAGVDMLGGQANNSVSLNDITAPTLSGLSLSSFNYQDADISISSDEAGTLYYVFTQSAVQPSAIQILNGQDENGIAADVFNNFSEGSANTYSYNIGALTATTTYHMYWIAEDAAGNQSNVVSASFTTDALPVGLIFTTNPVPSIPLNAGSSNNLIYQIQMDVSGGTATMIGMFFAPNGTYAESDFVQFNYYESRGVDDFGSSSLISSNGFFLGDGQIPDGYIGLYFSNTYTDETVYWYITADISSGATVSNTFGLDLPEANNNFGIDEDTNETDGGLAISEVFTIQSGDTTPPSVALSSLEADPTASGLLVVDIAFSEVVTGLLVSNVVVGNGIATNLIDVDGQNYMVDITPSSDGLVTVDLGGSVAQDLAGNDNTGATQFSITSDQTAPVITFDQDGLETNDIFLTGAVDDVFATVSISLDGGSTYDPVTNNGDGTWTYDLSANGSYGGDGFYAIDLDVIDLSGNFNLLSGASVTIDQTAPVITFDQDGLETNDIFLTGAVDDAFATVSISLDGGSIYDPVTNNGDGTWTYDLSTNGSFGGDGFYAIDLDVIDLSGNFNLLSGASVTIDQTAPVITFDQDGLETNDVFLSGTVDDASATVSISLDGGSIYDPVTNNGDGTWTYDLSTNGSFGGDGFYAIDLDVIDLSGNFNLLSGASVTIDQTAPVITFDQDGLETNDVFLSGTVDDASATVSISLDGGSIYDPVTNNGDGTWTYDLSANGSFGGDGLYSIDLDVIDLSGNFNLLSGASVTIDQTAPVITFDQDGLETNDIFLTGAVDDAFATVSISLDGGSIYDPVTNNGDGTWTYDLSANGSFGGDGLYSIDLDVIDLSGNFNLLSGASVTIDQTAPVITFDQDGLETNDIFLTGAVDDAFATVSISLDGGSIYDPVTNNGDGTWTYDLSTNGSFGGDGFYAIDLDVIDLSGNFNLLSGASVTIDQTAPVITFDQDGLETNDVFLSGTVDDASATVSISLDGGSTYDPVTNNGDGTWIYDLSTNGSYGGDGFYPIDLDVIDLSGNFNLLSGASVTIDQTAPAFTSTNTASADENSAIATVIYTAVATDAGTVTYSLSGTDAAAFALDGSTGELTFVSSPDFETQASYEVVITATDNATNSTDITVTVTINDLDEDTPVFTSLTTASADENSAITTVVYTAVATDAGTITYSLSGTDAAAFALDGSSGELTFVSSPDFETQVSYEVVITATDDATNNTDLTVTITVNDLDEDAPSFTSATTAAADENSAIATVIYTAVATDVGTITYSLSGTDAAAFALDGSTGELTFVSSPDFETQASYEVVITATDDATNSTDITVTVTINDLDEDTPVFTSLTTASADENSAITTVVYTAVATDAGTVTYSLSGTDAAAFALDGSTGELTFISSPDFETQASYEVVITGIDDATNNTDITVTVTINDLDEDTPVFTSLTTASADENSAITTVVYTAVATDAGTVTYSLSGTDAAAFALDGSTGELTFVSSPDFETQVSYEVVITATDDATNSTDITVTVTINDLDEDTPVFTSLTTASADENSAITTVIYTAVATDAGTVTYSLSGTDAAAFALDGSTGELTFVSSPDFETQVSYEVVITATDDATNNTDITVTVTINDLDEDTPVFTSLTTASADENSAIATVIYTAVATDAGTVTYSLSGTDAAAFALDGSSGELTFVSSPDFETQASYEVVITATDDATNSTDITVTVTINDLDEDTPVFTSLTTASADENSAITTVIYTAVATDAGVVTYSLSGTDAAAFALDGSSGELTFVSSPDFETQSSYEVVITATDDATNSTDITVTVTVNDLDEDAPTVMLSSLASDPTNATVIELEVVFSESVTGLIAGDFTVSNGVAGNLQGSGTTYTVDITPDADGILTVDLAAGSAQDAAGNDNTAAIQFSITVDQTLPTVVISSIAPNPTNAAMVLVDVTFGGSVTGFEIGDITITNGTASNFTGSGTTYSVDITPTADGAVTVDVPAGVAQDASGNDNVAAVQFMITSDRTAPVVTVDITGTSLASPSLSGTINENATMTVEVNSMSYTPMISGNTWSIAEGVITPDLTDGTYEVVATATDAAGNVGVDDTEDELTISQTVVALQASKITSSSFQANWSAGESDVIGYELDVSVDGFTTFVSGYNAKSLSNTVTSEVVTDLDFRTDYSYRVRLVNSGGAQGNSNTRTVTTIIKPETEDDFAALQIIYTETGGPSWTNQKSWLATRLQDWEDVTIDPTTQRVTGVNLSNNNLTGSFPLTLDLDQLTTLNLSGNNLNNLADLSELASLSNLDVSVNALAFDDLELVAGISTISYADQASIQFNESNTNANPIEVRYTGDYQLSVTLGGSANSYQWLRNGEAITNGEDFFINGSDNTILEIDYDNMGTFTVEVTSPLVSGLTINVDAQKVLAIANMTVEVRNSEGDLLPEMVDGYLLETIRLAKGYDTLEVAENAGSTFVFPDVVLGNYLMAADSDPEKYVPTYFGEGEIVEWDKAETVLFRSDDAIQLQMTEIPVELKEGDGDGKLDIVIEEDLDGNTGRVEARRRAARRKCGLRRKTGGGRTDEDADGFSLIAYGETDDNGEFQFGFLPEGTYRFFVEYPGIPLDDDSFVQFEVGEAGISDTDFKLEAFASEDGLEVNIEVVLGVILDYFKDLSVYPNPADKGLFIKYRHLKSRDVTAELVDLTGATKWSQELSSGYNGDIEIDVRDMEEGVYILYLYDRESRDENVVSYRVIVQH